jgi:hypothetical protein
MRRFLTPIALLAACVGCDQRGQASSPLVLDHLFVLVPPGANAAREALSNIGVIVDTTVSKHRGAGTASVAVRFESAYLELLWVDSSVTVVPELVARVNRYRAGTWGTDSPASPFGLGLRRARSAPDSLPFPSRRYAAEWMTAGTWIDVIIPPADSLPPPRVFVVPRDMGFDAWRRYEAPKLFEHPAGLRDLTAIRLVVPSGAWGELPTGFPVVSGLTVAPGEEHLAELTLDGGKQGRRVDLRPALPLLLIY